MGKGGERDGEGGEGKAGREGKGGEGLQPQTSIPGPATGHNECPLSEQLILHTRVCFVGDVGLAK